MCNLSFVSGCFADSLKLAKVRIPISVRIYLYVRIPISVLPVFSKILEKLMHVRVYEFFDSNLLLTGNQ